MPAPVAHAAGWCCEPLGGGGAAAACDRDTPASSGTTGTTSLQRKTCVADGGGRFERLRECRPASPCLQGMLSHEDGASGEEVARARAYAPRRRRSRALPVFIGRKARSDARSPAPTPTH